MANNQIDPNRESNQLNDEELEQVAGGVKIPEPFNDFVGDVVDAGKDLLSNLPDCINPTA